MPTRPTRRVFLYLGSARKRGSHMCGCARHRAHQHQDPDGGTTRCIRISGSCFWATSAFTANTWGGVRRYKIGQAMEARRRQGTDPRIINSESASFDSYLSQRWFANSLGFAAAYRSSSCSLTRGAGGATGRVDGARLRNKCGVQPHPARAASEVGTGGGTSAEAAGRAQNPHENATVVLSRAPHAAARTHL